MYKCAHLSKISTHIHLKLEQVYMFSAFTRIPPFFRPIILIYEYLDSIFLRDERRGIHSAHNPTNAFNINSNELSL